MTDGKYGHRGVLLFGIPGAGKSSVAQAVQSLNGDSILLDIDDVAEAAVASGVDYKIGYRIAFKHLKNFLVRNAGASSCFVICAGLTNEERWSVTMTTLNPFFGDRLQTVRLICSITTACSRVQARASVQATGNSREKILKTYSLHDRKVREIQHLTTVRNDVGDSVLSAAHEISALL